MNPSELRAAIVKAVHQAENFGEGYGAGTDTHDTVDAILDAVIASLPEPRNAPGDVRHHRKVLAVLQSAKSNQIDKLIEITTSPEVIEGAIQKRIDLLDRAKSISKEQE